MLILRCDGAFWTGRHWSTEYPDAKHFIGIPQAEIDRAFRAAEEVGFNGVELEASSDYGLDTEKSWAVAPSFEVGV